MMPVREAGVKTTLSGIAFIANIMHSSLNCPQCTKWSDGDNDNDNEAI